MKRIFFVLTICLTSLICFSITAYAEDDCNHIWSEWTVTKPATTEEEGEEIRTCSRCGEKETRSIPKMNTITLDLNGGTLNGKTGTIKYVLNHYDMLTLPQPVREGYTFDYWEGSRYNAGDLYFITEDHVFKAIWKKTPADDKSHHIPKTGIE